MLLAAEGLCLVGAAVILAVPLPTALAQAAWPARNPRAALVLWQAAGLSGGLAILGAGITLAVSGLHQSWLGGLAALPAQALPGAELPAAALSSRGSQAPGADLGPLGWAGLALTVIAGAWLALVLVTSSGRIVLARREHRLRLDLLADDLAVGDLLMTGAGHGGQLHPGLRVRLISHPLPAAYCLPGVRPRIVLSQGVVDALNHDQLEAVVTHERAHARGHHDLVIQPFRAWQQTFPFLTGAARALAAVELLVEMLADDVARRRCGSAPLLQALARLADDAPRDHQLAARADRLAAPPPLSRLAVASVYAAAALLVCLPPAVLLVS